MLLIQMIYFEIYFSDYWKFFEHFVIQKRREGGL